MKEYQSKKIVNGQPCTSTEWMSYRKTLKPDTYSDATLEQGLQGYMVIYNRNTEKEYWSWSPKEEFENGYTLLESNLPPVRVSKYS